jgi:sialic acid synthase SpsE
VVSPVEVGPLAIGPGEALFTIAEVGLNHNQDMDLALRLLDAAAQAGCSAAKFQTFHADDVYVEGARAGTYHLMGQEIPIYDLHKGLEMSAEWVERLSAACRERGLVFFSAPIGTRALAALEAVDVPAHKISSYELTDLPFVAEVAATGRAMILSTGAANLAEIAEAVACVRAAGAPLALMQCVTQYPAPLAAANLAVMDSLRAAFDVPVGFSDNGFVDGTGALDAIHVPLAAAQAGADLFEIHITLDRNLPGPDHGFATEPDELSDLVAAMNTARAAYNDGERRAIDPELWGSPHKRTQDAERYVRDFAFKSLFAIRDIAAGELLTRDNLRALRPGESAPGIAPKFLDTLAGGATARRPLAAFEPVTWDWLLA